MNSLTDPAVSGRLNCQARNYPRLIETKVMTARSGDTFIEVGIVPVTAVSIIVKLVVRSSFTVIRCLVPAPKLASM